MIVVVVAVVVLVGLAAVVHGDLAGGEGVAQGVLVELGPVELDADETRVRPPPP